MVIAVVIVKPNRFHHVLDDGVFGITKIVELCIELKRSDVTGQKCSDCRSERFTLSLGASKPATHGRFKTSRGVNVQ